MTDVPEELPRLLCERVAVTELRPGDVVHLDVPIVDISGRPVAPPSDPVVTTRDGEAVVAELNNDGSIKMAIPLLCYRVESAHRKSKYRRASGRWTITLADAESVRKSFALAGNRVLERVTTGGSPLDRWGLLGEHLAEAMAKRDTLWHKTTKPFVNFGNWLRRKGTIRSKVVQAITAPFVWSWRTLFDLQCRSYSLRLRAGFWGTAFILVIAAIALASRTPAETSVAVSILGAFLVERVWEHYKATSRRRLAKGVVLRVRYKQRGASRLKYASLALRPRTSLITPDMRPWQSTEMTLSRGQDRLAACAFANNIRDDGSWTCHDIADAIMHRINDGSSRVIHAASPRYVPDQDKLPDIRITPGEKSFTIDFGDHDDPQQHMSVSLKLHQMKVLADTLEVMDDGRRL